MVICPQCKKNSPGGKFCEQCGAALPVYQPPVTPTPPAPPAQREGKTASTWIIVAATALVVVLIVFGILYLLGSLPAPVQSLFTPPTPWAGTWDSTYGVMQLSQSGDFVMGSYTFQDGVITGTVTGRTLAGTWGEGPTYEPPDQAGDVILTISSDGSSLTGKWRNGFSGDWTGEWRAVKIAS